MSDQMPLQDSQAARNKFVDPDIKLRPDDSKLEHKLFSTPDDFAWSKICWIVLFTGSELEVASRFEVTTDALSDWATWDNMTATHDVHS